MASALRRLAQGISCLIMIAPRCFPWRSSVGLVLGQHDQVVAEDAQAHGRRKTPKSSKETTNQPKRAFQTGNSPLNPGSERLPVRQHLVDEVSHPPRYGQRVHLLGQLLELRLGRAESLVRCQHLGLGAEKLLVTLDHRLGQVAIGKLLLVDLVVGDELFHRLTQEHLVTELHRLFPSPTLDQFGVLLEEAEHPIRSRHCFTLDLGALPILVDCDGPVRRIIDGNHRKEIANELGYDCPEIVHEGEEEELRTLARALNLARRQLNREQKRRIIADQLRETPNRSARWIGKMLGVDGKTVADVRAELASTAEIPQLAKTVGKDGKERSVGRCYWVERRGGLPRLKRNADNPLDYYPTPDYITKALIARERFKGIILEPASGNGAIARVLRKAGCNVRGTDITNGVDFLKTRKCVENIVTNPPYAEGMAEKFCRHALAIAKRKVAMLLPLWFVVTVQRHDLFTEYPLKAVYIFSRTPTFGEDRDHHAPFGALWAVWDKSYRGKPHIEWILD